MYSVLEPSHESFPLPAASQRAAILGYPFAYLLYVMLSYVSPDKEVNLCDILLALIYMRLLKISARIGEVVEVIC